MLTFSPTEPLFKKSGILKISDQKHVLTCGLLWDLDKGELPPSLAEYFTKSTFIHDHNTRHANAGKYVIKKTNSMYGFKSFQVQGSRILNQLKSDEIYTLACSKISFINRRKKSIFNIYDVSI